MVEGKITFYYIILSSFEGGWVVEKINFLDYVILEQRLRRLRSVSVVWAASANGRINIFHRLLFVRFGFCR